MNLYAADPHWGWWIVLYFFFGGIAAGAYFVSTLIEWVGGEDDQFAARIGYRIAFPLILLCGVLLIVDLDYPQRFHHMLFKSEVVGQAIAADWPWTAEGWTLMASAPLLKYWSPMSVGSWAIAIFGLCSCLSMIGSFQTSSGPVTRVLSYPICGHTLRLTGAVVGLFVAAYTGVLLTATNQPIWSDSIWIASLFLTSATSTGIATVILISRAGKVTASRPSDRHSKSTKSAEGAPGKFRSTTQLGTHSNPLGRLERADLWALALELAVFTVFLASLGSRLLPILHTFSGKLLIGGVLVFGLFVPLAIHSRRGLTGRPASVLAAICVLIGGFVLRYAILATPAELSARQAPTASGQSLASFGPETGRRRGGGPGADPGNRPATLKPRTSKLSVESP